MHWPIAAYNFNFNGAVFVYCQPYPSELILALFNEKSNQINTTMSVKHFHLQSLAHGEFKVVVVPAVVALNIGSAARASLL